MERKLSVVGKYYSFISDMSSMRS